MFGYGNLYYPLVREDTDTGRLSHELLRKMLFTREAYFEKQRKGMESVGTVDIYTFASPLPTPSEAEPAAYISLPANEVLLSVKIRAYGTVHTSMCWLIRMFTVCFLSTEGCRWGRCLPLDRRPIQQTPLPFWTGTTSMHWVNT